MKLKIDWPAVRAAARTAGALMIGNVFVALLLLGNRHWLSQVMLFALGVGINIFTSLERKE